MQAQIWGGPNYGERIYLLPDPVIVWGQGSSLAALLWHTPALQFTSSSLSHWMCTAFSFSIIQWSLVRLTDLGVALTLQGPPLLTSHAVPHIDMKKEPQNHQWPPLPSLLLWISNSLIHPVMGLQLCFSYFMQHSEIFSMVVLLKKYHNGENANLYLRFLFFAFLFFRTNKISKVIVNLQSFFLYLLSSSYVSYIMPGIKDIKNAVESAFLELHSLQGWWLNCNRKPFWGNFVDHFFF